MKSGSKGRWAESLDSAKRLSRRHALKALGISGLALASGQALRARGAAQTTSQAKTARAEKRLRPLAEGTTPQSFTSEEFAVLAALVETIIPATGSPSARDAGVHWFLDDVARHEPKTKQQFKDGLKRIDELARAAHGKGFAEISADGRAKVLMPISDAAVKRGEKPSPDQAFFSFAKSRILDAYYRSEVGLLGELEWIGQEFNTTFPGACTHLDPLVHPRPRWQSART
jgi:hypothetical protein